nr:MAG TPA: hypothetical protein [Caudoviricetes sp.]
MYSQLYPPVLGEITTLCFSFPTPKSCDKSC